MPAGALSWALVLAEVRRRVPEPEPSARRRRFAGAAGRNSSLKLEFLPSPAAQGHPQLRVFSIISQLRACLKAAIYDSWSNIVRRFSAALK